MARVAFLIPRSQSLKEKRVVLNKIKDRVRHRFNAAVAEVDDNDVWQRAQLGLAVVGNDRSFVEGALDEVVRFVRAEVNVSRVEREFQTFSESFGQDDLAELITKENP